MLVALDLDVNSGGSINNRLASNSMNGKYKHSTQAEVAGGGGGEYHRRRIGKPSGNF